MVTPSGDVEAGFGAVADAFARNFDEPGEDAAAVAVVGGAVALDPTDGPSGSGHASATATVGSAGGSTTDPGATGGGPGGAAGGGDGPGA